MREWKKEVLAQVAQVCPRLGIQGTDLPALFGCICCAVVAHAYGAPCATILVLLYIWKDLMVCLVLESPRAGCAGSPSARHQRNVLICVLLSCLLHVLQSEAGAPSLFATATGQARQGTHTDPEVGAPSQSVSAPGQAQQRNLRPVTHPSLLRQLDRTGKGLTHTLRPIPVQTHLGRLSNGFDNSRQPASLSPCRCTNSIKMNWHPHSK